MKIEGVAYYHVCSHCTVELHYTDIVNFGYSYCSQKQSSYCCGHPDQCHFGAVLLHLAYHEHTQRSHDELW